MKKRIFLLLLSLSMMISMLPVAAYAESSTLPENFRFARINPLYAGTIRETDLVTPGQPLLYADNTGDGKYYDAKTAGEMIRDDLVARDTTISVNLSFPYNEATIEQDIQNQVCAVIASAMAHTGNPVEGDYLLWQYGGFQVETGNFTLVSGTQNLGLTVTFTMTYYSSAAQEAEMDAAVSDLLSELKVSGKDDYTKLKTIYDYITANVTYDYDNLNDNSYKLKYTAYAALINGTAVCQGYAALLYRLALELGVDCRMIPGNSDGQVHVWNIAALDGMYYNLDATWDTNVPIYQCFLVGSQNFTNHDRWDNPGQMPSNDNYNSAEFHAAYPISETDYTSLSSCDHVYTATVTEPTCTESGYTTYTCEKCNDSYEGDYTDPGHNFEFVETQAASCVQEGGDLYRCTMCGEQTIENATGAIDPNNHRNPTVEVVGGAPTCTNPFGDLYHCEDCYTYFYESTAFTGHTIQNNTCTVCGESLLDWGNQDNAWWYLSTDGTLTICGTGTLTGAPWASYKKQIKTFVVDSNVTHDDEWDGESPLDMDYPNLTSIHLSNDALDNSSILYRAPALQEITVESGHPEKYSVDGILYTNAAMQAIDRYPVGRMDTEFTIPDGIEYIFGHAFYGAERLEKVHLAESVTVVQFYAFANCISLKEFRFLNGEAYTMNLSQIFTGCTGLRRVWLGDAFWHMHGDFVGCTSLDHLYVLNPETRMANYNEQPAKEDLPGVPGKTVIHGWRNSCAQEFAESYGYTFQELTDCDIQGHNLSHVAAIEPTCGTNGTAEHWHCTVCGKNYADEDYFDEIDPVLPALDHSWDEGKVTKEPTEEETGIRTYTCNYCGDTRTETIPTLEHSHNYTAVITAPTCTEKGYTTYTCTCGDTYTGDEVAALGHSWDEGEITAEPTEEKTGICTYTCQTCGATRTEEIPAIEHTHIYKTVVTDPTCTEKGYITYTCTCGDTYTGDEVAALGHNEVTDKGYAATCTEEGLTDGAHCGRCEIVLVQQEMIPATGHHFEEESCTGCSAKSAWITTQPKTGYAKMGQTVKVSVEASGDGLTYQWYIKNADGSRYSKSSVTTATYSTQMSDKSKGRRVYCVITDAYGNQVQTKTVLLREAVSVVTEPKTGYAKMGQIAKVSVEASGDGLSYQWYIKNANGTKYSKSAVTGPTYSCRISDSSKGRRVLCIITDAYGNEVQSKTVMLREAVSVTTEPKNTYVKSGSTAKVSLKASGDGLKYQWYIKNAGQTKYSKSSVTSATYSCKMNDKSKDRLAYCVVTDQYGNTVKSKTVILRMTVTITTQPKDVTASKGKVARVTFEAEGDGLTYQWYIKNAGQTSYSRSAVTSAAYSCTMSDKTDGRQAYCVVTDKYGKTVKTSVIMLKMK